MLATRNTFVTTAIATLAVCACLAGPERTDWTSTEFGWAFIDPGIQFTDGDRLLIMEAKMTCVDAVSDERLSGNSVLGVNAIWKLAEWIGPMWGSYELENAGGRWEGYWMGERVPFADSDGTTHIRSVLYGAVWGTGGYAGLVARFDFEGVDTLETGSPLLGTGYILEAQGNRVQRPLTTRTTREEHISIYPGLFLPDTPGALAVWEIEKETGKTSHMGVTSNVGIGLFDPATGSGTGFGTLTGANGDSVFWVVNATTDLATGIAKPEVCIAGGTGRFDAAIGWATGELHENITPLNEWELEACYNYTASGWIAYSARPRE